MAVATGTLIAAGVGAAASVVGGVIGANAQQGTADANRRQAEQTKAQALAQAAPTAQEIQSIGDRIQQQQRYQSVQEASLQRDQQILGSLDPALITAGQQANNLMKGQQAAILAPMKQQQDFERNQLRQKLAAQLGPGFETSSAGQQALQSFDMQANMQSQQAQMGALNQVSQFLGFGMQQRTGLQNQERMGFETGSQMSTGTLHAMNNIQTRQVGAITGTSHAMQATSGNEFSGQSAAAGIVSGLGKSVSSMAGMFGGMSGGGGGMSSTTGNLSGMNYGQPASSMFGVSSNPLG